MRVNLRRPIIDESYDIVFGEDLFPQIAEDLKQLLPGYRCAIITDSNVGPLYARSLKNALREAGLVADTFYFEAGEQRKTRKTKEKIEDQMLVAGLGRDTVVLALGGGVTGDLAGFVAGTFNRGVPYIQIPTTLLAQADSSVGGKVAVDTPHGKNVIGQFKQPKKVYVDVSMLKTLPEREFITGLAETVKHGIILDRGFFDYLRQNADPILARESEALLAISRTNCRLKGCVVEKDPEEQGLRRILNYGHTVGHALEQLSDFQLPHGEAVSIGMMVAGRISVLLGYLSQQELTEQEQLLRKMKLPTSLPQGTEVEQVITITSRDKKAKGGRVRYVLPIAIGEMHDFDGDYATYVDSSVVLEALR